MYTADIFKLTYETTRGNFWNLKKKAFPRNYCAIHILTLKTCLLTKETGRNRRSLTQKEANLCIYCLFLASQHM